MALEDILRREGRAGALRLLDLADLISARERGVLLRDWSEIASGDIPDPARLSRYSRAVLREAARQRADGVRAEPITGLAAKDALARLSPHLCARAVLELRRGLKSRKPHLTS